MTARDKKLGHAIRSGSAWMLGGNAVTEVVGFLVGIVLARLLLPAEFGLVATAGVVTGLAGFFAGAGMGQALVRAREVSERHFQVVFTLQCLIGLALYGLFVLFAGFYARFFGHAILHDMLLLSALSFLLRPFASIPGARLNRALRFRSQVIINGVTLLVGSACSILLALAGWSVWSLIISGLLTALLRVLLLNMHVRQPYYLAWDPAIARELGSYGAKVAANSLIEHFRLQSVVMVIAKLSGQAEVGLYNRASSLGRMPMQIVGNAPYQAVFRALAAEQDNLDRSRYLYFRTITLVSIYTLPLFILIAWLAEPGIRFVYGEVWLSAAAPLQILAITGVMRCVASPSGAVIEARNRVGIEIRINLATWVLLVAGVIYGLDWGLVGVAAASAVAYTLYSAGICLVAVGELRGRFSQVMRALRPAVMLAAAQFVALWVGHAWAFSKLEVHSPGLYCTAMSMLGGGVYFLGFLLHPPQTLRSEANRWRSLLRLKPLEI